jgi:acyl-CoA synthetase (AMP-forming)/AMP-acid ligase II
MQVEAGALVRQTAERFGDRTALTAQARSLSFTDLNAAANRVGSALLELGARRGDRVGVLAYNTQRSSRPDSGSRSTTWSGPCSTATFRWTRTWHRSTTSRRPR